MKTIIFTYKGIQYKIQLNEIIDAGSNYNVGFHLLKNKTELMCGTTVKSGITTEEAKTLAITMIDNFGKNNLEKI